MSSYQMEELLPVVAALTAKYTRNESTSVTYEKAEQLMGAVLFCIQEYETAYVNDIDVIKYLTKSNEILSNNHVDAKTAYESGYQIILQKVERVRTAYGEMLSRFQSYENENYCDTVEKGIPGFFKLYDPRFAPQDTIITMDYPLLQGLQGLQGIDAIEQYVFCICLEQRFLQEVPQERVMEILAADHPDYRKQFYNICGVALREMLCQKRIREWIESLPEEQVQNEAFRTELGKRLEALLRALMEEQYENDQDLLHYLEAALPDICTELISGYGL